MANIQTGDTIILNSYGPCRVTFVGSDYIGICTEEGKDAMIRKGSEELTPWSEENEAAWRAAINERAAQKEAETDRPWPESTFVVEPEDATHYMGSHWEPFYEQGVKEILNRLPETIEAAGLVKGFGDIKNPPRPLPESWVKGYHLIWPQPEQGEVLTIAINEAEKQNEFRTIFPYWKKGACHRLSVREVLIFESGVEAQITADLGEAEVTFFDAHYLLNRAWYERTKEYDFILTGIAYGAKTAEVTSIPFTPPSDQIAWDAMLAEQRGEDPPKTPTTIKLDGAAFFLAISEWDADDYSFRGPIKEVQTFADFLGQDGWLVRVTVFRLSEYRTEDVDLEIVITPRAWEGESAPEVGQDIEGRLWLQGYLHSTVQEARHV